MAGSHEATGGSFASVCMCSQSYGPYPVGAVGKYKNLKRHRSALHRLLGFSSEEGDNAGMIFIPGGSFTMGSNRERPEERFTHVVQVDGFWIDRHEVTNAEFDKFVKATGYITLAERGVDPKTHPGMSQDMLAPGSVIFIPPTALSRGGDLPSGGNM